MRISGGEFVRTPAAEAGSFVTLFGTEFFLNGAPFDLLGAGSSMTILDRNVSLAGVLADGSSFNFDLNARSFNNGATLRIVLVPEPASALLLLLAGPMMVSIRRITR